MYVHITFLHIHHLALSTPLMPLLLFLSLIFLPLIKCSRSWWQQHSPQLFYLTTHISQSGYVARFVYYIFFQFLWIYFKFFILFYFNCSGFCHTLKWNSHRFTCVPHPDSPPPHLPLHPIPLGLPSAPGPSACLMHPTWAGDLLHPR